MKETSEMPNGSVNLNDEVWVQLTDLGWKVYDDFHSDVPLEPEKLRALVEDPSGWQKFQLWSLMEIYGPHTHHGMDSGFFERLELRLQRPTTIAPSGEQPPVPATPGNREGTGGTNNLVDLDPQTIRGVVGVYIVPAGPDQAPCLALRVLGGQKAYARVWLSDMATLDWGWVLAESAVCLWTDPELDDTDAYRAPEVSTDA
jgi:hypothetical protein